MSDWLSGPVWAREDRYLRLALKIGLVAGILAVETIMVVSFAYTMWEAVR